MQRLLGAIFILIGCLGYGYSYMEKERQKIAFAKMWENFMLMFYEEIAFKKQSLAFAAYEIGKKVKEKERECFIRIYDKMVNQNQKGFATIWLEEWNTYYEKQSLSTEEKKLIEEFAEITGFNDEKVQIKMLEEQQRKWRKVQLDLMEGQQERKKMVWTLSACSGAILILILL